MRGARPELEDVLRAGAPLPDVARRSGVRTKLGVNMGALGEPEVTRLSCMYGNQGNLAFLFPMETETQVSVPKQFKLQASSSSGKALVSVHEVEACSI